MARTSEPHSATSQFFINHVDNPHLDRENDPKGWGYCVFGRVIKGMDVVDMIASVPTANVGGGLADFPYDPPVIMSQVQVLPCELSYDSDFDKDGRVGLADCALFSVNWLDQCTSANGFCQGSDLDFSGGVDVVDLQIFLQHWAGPAGYEPQASDLSVNGSIDLADLTTVAACWLDSDCGQANDFCRGADINHNGRVDLADFALLSGNWLLHY